MDQWSWISDVQFVLQKINASILHWTQDCTVTTVVCKCMFTIIPVQSYLGVSNSIVCILFACLICCNAMYLTWRRQKQVLFKTEQSESYSFFPWLSPLLALITYTTGYCGGRGATAFISAVLHACMITLHGARCGVSSVIQHTLWHLLSLQPG